MLRKWIVAAGLMMLVSAPAQAVITGMGPRVGFSVSPDQIVGGGHIVVGPIAKNITFDPSIELGLGDHVTTVALNFDLHYHFDIKETDWRPYAGAGMVVTFVDSNSDTQTDNSSTGTGGEVILGAGVPTSAGNRFFGEVRFGLGDEVANLKLIVGWNFPTGK